MITRVKPALVLALFSLFLALSTSTLQADGKEIFEEQLEVTIADDPFVPLYRSMVEAIEEKSVLKLEEAIAKAVALKREKGLENLSEYSRALIHAANSTTDQFEANRLYETAVLLSPKHPFILYEVERSLAGAPTWQSLFKLGVEFWAYPSLLIPFLSSLVYPILLALTFGLLLTGICLLIAYPSQVLAPLAKFGVHAELPKQFALIILPACVLALFLGPLACVTFFAVLLAPTHRGYVLLSAALLILWGVAVPLHENVSAWEKDPGVKSALRILEGDRGPGAVDRVVKLYGERSEDPLLLNALLTILLQEREYDAALDLVKEIETLEGESAWTARNKGILHYIHQDYEAANEVFEDAKKRGADDPTFLFWFSKVKFEVLDTEASRQLFLEARRADESKVQELEAQEGMQQEGAGWLGTTFAPPFSHYVTSARVPLAKAALRSKERINTLFFPLNAGLLILLGIALVVSRTLKDSRKGGSTLLKEEGSDDERRLLYLVPGGALTSARFTLASVPFTTALFLALFLTFGWPGECGRFFELFPELAPVVLFFVSVFVMIGYVFGWTAIHWRRQ